MPKGAFEFKCYTCQLPLGREFQDGAQWKNHVLHDIDPYVCLFEDCATSNVLYKSSDDWWQHTQTHHRISWFCPTAAHRQQTFGSRAELEAHLRSEHANSVPSNQMAFILDDSVYPLHPIFEVCPICGTTADLLRSSKTSASELLILSTQIQDPLRRHIESHLDEIALLSLLPLPEASGNTGYREVGADNLDVDNTDRAIKYLPLPVYDAEYLASTSLDCERADPDDPPLKLADADELSWRKKCAEVQAYLDGQRNAQWYLDEVVQKQQIEVILSRRQHCPRAASCFIHHIRNDATSAKIMQLTRDLDGIVDVIIESSSAGTGRACELVFGTTDAAVDALITIKKWVDLAGSARLESRLTELHDCFLETIQRLALVRPPVLDSFECIPFLYHDIQCLRLARWGKAAGIVNLDEQRGRIVACYLTEQQEIEEAKRLLGQILSVHDTEDNVAESGGSGILSLPVRAFETWQGFDLARRIGKLCANVDREMKRTLGPNQMSSRQASLGSPKLINFGSVLRLTSSIDEMLDKFEKTLALQAALAAEEVKKMAEELDDNDMAALQELSVDDPVLAGAVGSAIVPDPGSSALSQLPPLTPWESIMRRADSVVTKPGAGHNYGKVIAKSKAKITQGNVYDQLASFLAKQHHYGDMTYDDAQIIAGDNVFQGDISSSMFKEFWYGRDR
ncbi:hypothetical protein LTR24_003428 [Lithohypha guttulata]|uniref:C2H2-type domain-containing protein n=1 Tax=Lithohypha guttulata TaxID=1690604 RepID=A0ABR0KEW0_9EURO|nr:hypothetical protein LTR24_003428 [Lithohypha guttulata]